MWESCWLLLLLLLYWVLGADSCSLTLTSVGIGDPSRLHAADDDVEVVRGPLETPAHTAEPGARVGQQHNSGTSRFSAWPPFGDRVTRRCVVVEKLFSDYSACA